MTSKRKIINSNFDVIEIFLSLAIIFLFSSCLPLTQTYGDFTDQGVTVMGESRHVVININPKNYPSEPKILSEKSYAVHESGDQYPLIVNPEEILEYRNSKYVISDYLYLKAPKNYLTKYKSWQNGIWTLYLKLQCDQKIYDKHISFELDTFYYNPLIHGAPN